MRKQLIAIFAFSLPTAAMAHADEYGMLLILIGILTLPFIAGVLAGGSSIFSRSNPKKFLLISFITYLIVAWFLISLDSVGQLVGIMVLGGLPFTIAFYISRYAGLRIKQFYTQNKKL
jgi:hypothetical protein